MALRLGPVVLFRRTLDDQSYRELLKNTLGVVLPFGRIPGVTVDSILSEGEMAVVAAVRQHLAEVEGLRSVLANVRPRGGLVVLHGALTEFVAAYVESLATYADGQAALWSKDFTEYDRHWVRGRKQDAITCRNLTRFLSQREALGDTERRRWDDTLGFLEGDVTSLELFLTTCDRSGGVAPWGETRPRDVR